MPGNGRCRVTRPNLCRRRHCRNVYHSMNSYRYFSTARARFSRGRAGVRGHAHGEHLRGEPRVYRLDASAPRGFRRKSRSCLETISPRHGDKPPEPVPSTTATAMWRVRPMNGDKICYRSVRYRFVSFVSWFKTRRGTFFFASWMKLRITKCSSLSSSFICTHTSG